MYYCITEGGLDGGDTDFSVREPAYVDCAGVANDNDDNNIDNNNNTNCVYYYDYYCYY